MSSDGNRELLKELLLQLDETPASERPSTLARMMTQHPDMAGELSSYVVHMEAGDEPFFGSPDGRELPGSLGRYRVVRLLGRGGMGEVYLAVEPPPMEREVAVKVIRPGSGTRQMRRRFEFERDTLKSLDHEHVAKVLDGGMTDEGVLFVAMEFIDGPPITLYAASRSLGLIERVALLRQVAGGIAHAHVKGLVHRDLKPANVLVTEREGSAKSKVIDFGIARPAEGSVPGLETLPGLPMGTLEYMSPEQALGLSSQIDQRSDVYSLGVMLYELVTGRTPRTRQELLELLESRSLDQLESSAVAAPSSLVPPELVPASQMIGGLVLGGGQGRSATVLRELDWVIGRALEVRPERRYRGAQELADDLDRLMRGEAVEAAPPSKAYRLRKLVSRHRGAAFGIVGVTAALAALAVVLLVSGAQVRSALAQARAERDAALHAGEEKQRAVKFLTGVLMGATPQRSPEHATVAEIVDEAGKKLETAIPASDVARLEIRRALSDAMRFRGDTDRAENHARLLVQESEEHQGVDSYWAGVAHFTMGLAAMQRGDSPLQRASMERAIEVLGRYRDELSRMTWISASMGLATLEADEGRLRASAEKFRDAIRELDVLMPNHPNRLSARWTLISVLSDLGESAESLRLADEAMEILKLCPAEQATSYEMRGRQMRAVALRAVGRTEESVAEMQELVALNEHWYGPRHRRTVAARLDLIESLEAAGMARSELASMAMGLLDEAMGEQGGEALGTQSIRLVCARLLNDANLPEMAEPIAAEAARVFEARYGQSNMMLLHVRHQQARSRAALGRVDEAIATLEPVPELAAQTLGAEHELTRAASTLLRSLHDRRGRPIESTPASGPPG